MDIHSPADKRQVNHDYLDVGRKGSPVGPLHTVHRGVQGLGVLAETAMDWESGYASEGRMRGRYTVRLKNDDGVLIGYLGIATAGRPSCRAPGMQ